MESATQHAQSSAADAIVPFHSNTLVDDVSLINEVLLQLIKTIDLNELATRYYQQLKRFLPTHSVAIAYANRTLVKGQVSTRFKKGQTLALQVANPNDRRSNVAVIKYCFTRQLTVCESALIEKLHQVFCHPFHHALHLDKLATLATKDGLTTLGNRAAFDEDLNKRLAGLRRGQDNFALMVLDLDNFKAVNDKFGHERGDHVLCETATCIADSLRENDSAYRFGGDEFCCIVDAKSKQDVVRVVSRVQQHINDSDLLGSHHIGASIGATMASEKDTVAAIFRRADEALYEVKNNGKHGAHIRLI